MLGLFFMYKIETKGCQLYLNEATTIKRNQRIVFEGAVSNIKLPKF